MERKISDDKFAAQLQMKTSELQSLFEGETPVTLSVARKLTAVVGATVEFWLTRDLQYQESLVDVRNYEWVQRLPLKEMVRRGWVKTSSDWRDRLATCLNFFGIKDVRDWEAQYGPSIEVLFRSSPTYDKDKWVVSAWLRQSERLASAIPTQEWNRPRFIEVLHSVRSMSTWPDPQKFLPALTQSFAQAGVALVILQAPPGCPVSGASHFVNGRPCIVLSARHLSDDHLWFTLYHEGAHLILHDPSQVFIDGDEANSAADGTEAEANYFAQQILVPRGLTLTRRPTAQQVIRVAAREGISPGILVGQLQHANVVGHDALNSLKRRYRWNGASLERA